MIYSDNAIKAAEKAGKAWLLTARAMNGAKMAAVRQNPNNVALAAKEAQEAADKCRVAYQAACRHADAALGSCGLHVANYAAAAAEDAAAIAEDAAAAANSLPEGIKT